MNVKPKPLNGTQRTALGWAKARGGKIRRISQYGWKPGTEPDEPRIIGHNTVVSLVRRGLLKESAWKAGGAIEVEVVPADQAVPPAVVGMEMRAYIPGLCSKRS